MNSAERVKYFYEVVVSDNRIETLSDFIDENCVLRVGETTIPIGIEGMRQHLSDVRKTYPDYSMRILRQYTHGEYVISEFIMTGTHKGNFLGITPTNKVISITGVDIDRVTEGRIAEHGGAANTFEAFYENNLIKPV